jgi:geranylgeranyl pyrophosphate synthase
MDISFETQKTVPKATILQMVGGKTAVLTGLAAELAVWPQRHNYSQDQSIPGIRLTTWDEFPDAGMIC